jgi:hypothetical protein
MQGAREHLSVTEHFASVSRFGQGHFHQPGQSHVIFQNRYAHGGPSAPAMPGDQSPP